MKTKLKFLTMVAGSALAVAGIASAGAKFTGDGSVSIVKNADGSGTATGLLGHIYNGSGVNQYIGCQKFVSGGVFCHAKTEALLNVACSSSSAFLGNAISGLTPDARLTFRFNANGQCLGITIAHSSEFQDKQG